VYYIGKDNGGGKPIEVAVLCSGQSISRTTSAG